jgi:hypothetical protein
LTTAPAPDGAANGETAGQRKKRKKGNRYIGAATGETSVSAGRTQTREGARYRRLARRIGKDKIQVALSGTQLKVYRKLLSSPGPRYQDLGAGYYDKHAQARRKVRHHLPEILTTDVSKESWVQAS